MHTPQSSLWAQVKAGTPPESVPLLSFLPVLILPPCSLNYVLQSFRNHWHEVISQSQLLTLVPPPRRGSGHGQPGRAERRPGLGDKTTLSARIFLKRHFSKPRWASLGLASQSSNRPSDSPRHLQGIVVTVGTPGQVKIGAGQRVHSTSLRELSL